MENRGIDQTEFSRLRWRCRRGLLELDLILDAFLNNRYPRLNDVQKQQFQRLLELPDNTLLAYVQGREIPTDPEVKEIIKKVL